MCIIHIVVHVVLPLNFIFRRLQYLNTPLCFYKQLSSKTRVNSFHPIQTKAKKIHIKYSLLRRFFTITNFHLVSIKLLNGSHLYSRKSRFICRQQHVHIYKRVMRLCFVPYLTETSHFLDCSECHLFPSSFKELWQRLLTYHLLSWHHTLFRGIQCEETCEDNKSI